MDTRDESITFLVTADEKRKFEQFIEDNDEYDSLSRFFRVLGFREMKGRQNEVEIDQHSIVDAVGIGMADVREELNQISHQIDTIGSEVDESEEIDQLARDLYKVLPHTTEEEFAADSFDEIVHNLDVDSLAGMKKISTASCWARYFDVSVSNARLGLVRCSEYFTEVDHLDESFEGASGESADLPERRWFRRKE